MNVCILMASPRKNGNTAELLKPFIKELEQNSFHVRTIFLQDLHINPCTGCCHCQNIPHEYGCSQKDDMQSIVDAVTAAEIVIYATPVYTWFCTPELKIVMDRLFGLNKFYGSTHPHTLWNKTQLGIIATCGYEPDQGADLFEEAVKRLCIHSHIDYTGALTVQDINGIDDFKSKDAVNKSKKFAHHIINSRNTKTS